MSMIAAAPKELESLSLSFERDEHGLIDRAAKAEGKDLADFVREAARHAAERTLFDQPKLILAGESTYAAFAEALDRPAQPSDRLIRTMQVEPPWEAA